jgi:hypothetical protein
LGLGAGLVREHEEIVQNLLREFIVVEQRAGRVGHDELIGFLAVAHGEGVVFIVFDEAHDLELQFLSVRRFDDENVAKFEQAVICGRFFLGRTVRMGVIVGLGVVTRPGVAVR